MKQVGLVVLVLTRLSYFAYSLRVRLSLLFSFKELQCLIPVGCSFAATMVRNYIRKRCTGPDLNYPAHGLIAAIEEVKSVVSVNRASLAYGMPENAA